MEYQYHGIRWLKDGFAFPSFMEYITQKKQELSAPLNVPEGDNTKTKGLLIVGDVMAAPFLLLPMETQIFEENDVLPFPIDVVWGEMENLRWVWDRKSDCSCLHRLRSRLIF